MTAAAVQDPPGRVRIPRLDRIERDRLQRNALRLASILVHFNQPSVNAGGSGGGRFRRRLEFGYDLGGPGGASPRHRAWPSRRRSPRRPAPPRSPSPRSIPAESPCPKPLAPHWTSRRDRCRTPHQRARRTPADENTDRPMRRYAIPNGLATSARRVPYGSVRRPSSDRRRRALSRRGSGRQPVAPRGHGNETTGGVGAVGIDAPERPHADAAVLYPGEEDPITLWREIDDLELVRPARFGQQRHRSGRHVEHPELPLTAGSALPRREGDPITGGRPDGVPHPPVEHLLTVGAVGLGNHERLAGGLGDMRSIGRVRPTRQRTVVWRASVDREHHALQYERFAVR